jgi:aminoglycoside phosphotransferase family enzyme
MKRIRDAQTIVGMLEDGDFANDLGKAITDMTAELKQRCGNRPKAKMSGEIKVTLKFEVDQNSVTISTGIDPKLPKVPRADSFYWVADDGSLSTEHPQQTDMFAGPRVAGERSSA